MSPAGGGGGGGSGKEPPGSRWAKGTSGNPKGRPRKATEPTCESADITELLISESERQITLTEGGNRITMPAGQAAIRATLVSALKGNAHAQRTFLQMTGAAKTQAEKAKRDNYQQALLVRHWTQVEVNMWRKQDVAETDLPRHPSDVELNPETLEVKNHLLYTEDAFEARKRAIALRDHLIETMAKLLSAAQQDGDDDLLKRGRELASRLIDMLNDLLPSRFRRYLPDHTPSVSAEQSPEEIWRVLVEQATAGFRDEPGRAEEKEPRRRPVPEVSDADGGG